MSGFSAFVLNLIKSGNCCSAQHQLSLVENNLTGAYELRLMVVIELYVNATYYTQHPTLKLV